MANFNLNKVILGGRITAEPELKTTQSGISVTTFTVAINRRYSSGDQQAADFITVVAWRQTAEFVTRYFHKGSSICVIGSLQTRTWTDPQTNQKRYATEVVADEVNFVDSKNDNSTGRQAGGAGYMPESYGSAPTITGSDNGAPRFEEMANDDDLPF
jgi:single-strand DNA-binding protein